MIDLLSGFKKQSLEEEMQMAERLAFLEQVLLEEDPDFVQSLEQIKIDDAAVIVNQASILEDAFDVITIVNQQSAFYPLMKVLARPFMIKRHPKKVILFWLCIGAVTSGAYKLYQSKILEKKSKLFISSYADLGVTVHDYDMLVDVESYFDNPKFSKNLMSLLKMTANIRPSEKSSDNPMVSFEIAIEGLSNDPIVEIKDREAEFRDLILRSAEDFNYDELDTVEGKQKLADAILTKINANLSKGQIRKVYYKNIVIKP